MQRRTGVFSTIESGLPNGKTLFSAGWVIGLGELEYFFVEQSISTHIGDG